MNGLFPSDNPLGLVWPLSASRKLELLSFLDEEAQRLQNFRDAAADPSDASMRHATGLDVSLSVDEAA